MSEYNKSIEKIELDILNLEEKINILDNKYKTYTSNYEAKKSDLMATLKRKKEQIDSIVLREQVEEKSNELKEILGSSFELLIKNIK